MGGTTYATVQKATTTVYVVTDILTTPNKVVGVYHSRQFALEENGIEFEIGKDNFSDYNTSGYLIHEAKLDII